MKSKHDIAISTTTGRKGILKKGDKYIIKKPQYLCLKAKNNEYREQLFTGNKLDVYLDKECVYTVSLKQDAIYAFGCSIDETGAINLHQKTYQRKQHQYIYQGETKILLDKNSNGENKNEPRLSKI